MASLEARFSLTSIWESQSPRNIPFACELKRSFPSCLPDETPFRLTGNKCPPGPLPALLASG